MAECYRGGLNDYLKFNVSVSKPLEYSVWHRISTSYTYANANQYTKHPTCIAAVNIVDARSTILLYS